MKLKDLITDKTAIFVEFHSDTLFYRINDFRFGIPVNELGGASIKAEEKASMFMKWIKRTLKEIDNADINK